jgi:hypothetical protein
MENTTQTNKLTIIATDSLSTLLAASGNRWTRNPKTRNFGKSIDNSRNQRKLIWEPSYVAISVNEAVDQTAKDALTEEIGNQETYPPQDLIKWMKKEMDSSQTKKMGKRWKWDEKPENISKLAKWHGRIE